MLDYEFDYFASHSSVDKPTVRRVVELLRDHGARVWFDETEIGLGDHVFIEIERAMESSRTLIFFASSHALNSEWVKIERSAAVFRDPSNKQRRFVIVRLDDAPLPEMLRGYLHLVWPSEESQQSDAIRRLLNNSSGAPDSDSGSVRYYDLFTPGAPPSRSDLLVGRDAQLKMLLGYLHSPGVHPIVIGARGIGKTSLVRAALQRLNIKRHSILEVNTTESFDECCKLICKDLGIKPDVDSFSPASFLRTLKKVSDLAVVSIDELDDVPRGTDIARQFAKFIKAASNQAAEMPVKFIFSGIGDDAHDIFHEHLSSDRALPQIYLEELSADDLRIFLKRAGDLLDAPLPPHTIDSLISEADGFPYYM